MGHMSKDCRSNQTRAFEAGDQLAETMMHRNGKRQFECIGNWNSGVAGKRITEFVLESIRVLQ